MEQNRIRDGGRDRKLYIDLLRVVAGFSVIMLHSASQYWYELPVTDARWIVCNSWDAVSRFGVPVFFMISGVLFLSREGKPDLRRLFGHNILRLAAAYGIWSVVYGLWDCREWMGAEGVTVRDYATEIVMGRYHLWFIPVMMGIYILLPVIKTFTDHGGKREIEYFLAIFLALQVGRGTLAIVNVPSLLNVWIQLLDVEMACSYIGYFVLGYYLCLYRLSGKRKMGLYILGGAGLILAAAVSNVTSVYYQEPRATAFDSYSVFTFLASAAVFVFFQEKMSGIQWKGWGRKLIIELSDNVFGVYLLHILVIEQFQTAGFDVFSIGRVFGGTPAGTSAAGCAVGIPILAVCCYVVSNAVISLVRRVPFLGRYAA